MKKKKLKKKKLKFEKSKEITIELIIRILERAHEALLLQPKTGIESWSSDKAKQRVASKHNICRLISDLRAGVKIRGFVKEF